MTLFYLFLIAILSIIIMVLIFRINVIKSHHEAKLIDLKNKLALLSTVYEKSNEKLNLDLDCKKIMDDARIKLNQDILDLQMDLFKKIDK